MTDRASKCGIHTAETMNNRVSEQKQCEDFTKGGGGLFWFDWLVGLVLVLVKLIRVGKTDSGT